MSTKLFKVCISTSAASRSSMDTSALEVITLAKVGMTSADSHTVLHTEVHYILHVERPQSLRPIITYV
jgi:hypothetical protein